METLRNKFNELLDTQVPLKYVLLWTLYITLAMSKKKTIFMIMKP